MNLPYDNSDSGPFRVFWMIVCMIGEHVVVVHLSISARNDSEFRSGLADMRYADFFKGQNLQQLDLHFVSTCVHRWMTLYYG